MPGALPPDLGQSESSKSPLLVLADILRDEKLTLEDKATLQVTATQRFKHRRIMAYLALAGLLLIGIGDFVNAEYEPPAWLIGSLVAVVLGYYGVSAWRPTS